MEKILLAIDAENIDIPAIEFACYVATLSRSKLTGIFIGNGQTETLAKIGAHDRSPKGKAVRSPEPAKPGSFPEENVRMFGEICSNRSVRSELLHMEARQAARDMITESRFADLIILKADICFDKQVDTSPSHFFQELLAGAECPVLAAPPAFSGIDEIIFTYDGSRSSVFAIKQFNYLFPRLSNQRAMLLEVTEKATGELTAKEKIMELLKAHYSGIGFHTLHGKTADELFAYLLQKKNSMVVMGAYGRKLFSKILKQSTASQLLKAVDCPFFITHC
jgi:nucleotide-binding universal stress UspA family protein